MVIVRKIFLLFLLLVVPLVSATNNLQSHNASQIYPQNFTSGNYIFPENVTAEDTLLSKNLNLTGNATIADKISFRLGEYMDNLVDGWFRFFGNINMMGNKIENVSIMNASTIYGDNLTLSGNLTSDWATFNNLNVTGTSYLGTMNLEGGNITASFIKGNGSELTDLNRSVIVNELNDNRTGGDIHYSGKLSVDGNTDDNSAEFGSFGLQSYGVNNAWLSDNAYYDGTNFRYRANGKAILTRFSSNYYFTQTSATGTAGDVLSTLRGKMYIMNDQYKGLGVSHAVEGTYTFLQVGNVVTPDNYATTSLTPISASGKGLVVQGYTSQTANLTEWQDSAGKVLASVDKDGNIISEGNITAEDLDLTGSLNYPTIYCEASDLTDQTFAVAGKPYRINITTTDEGNGISMFTGNNGTNITIVTSGVYHMVLQPQVKAGAGDAGDFHMWLEKDTGAGFSGVAHSNIELKLSSLEEDVIVLATTLSLDEGDVIRAVASVSDNGILLHTQSPAGEPIIPSIIFTMYRVGS